MTLPHASPACKVLVLGTALWGWKVERATAHRILDRYVTSGGRIVDTAANYPITKRPEDFGVAAGWIADWIAANRSPPLAVLVKVGATDNSGGTTSDLTASFIARSERHFRGLYGSALGGMAVHWDNRGNGVADAQAIAETVHAFERLHTSGLSIGLSGIRHPELYLEAAPALSAEWWIQVKENAMTDEARRRYSKVFPSARYLAYGINMGGFKREPANSHSSVSLRGLARPQVLMERMLAFLESDHGLRPPPRTINDLALAMSFLNPALCGIIIGPSDVDQLVATMRFWERLQTEASEAMIDQIPSFTTGPAPLRAGSG